MYQISHTYVCRMAFIFAVFVATLLLSCRSQEPIPPQEDFNLVWEAWDVLTTKYVGAHSIDTDRIAGDMITGILEASNDSHYPFLLELDNFKGRPSKDVPAELVDVWKTWELKRDTINGIRRKMMKSLIIF